MRRGVTAARRKVSSPRLRSARWPGREVGVGGSLRSPSPQKLCGPTGSGQLQSAAARTRREGLRAVGDLRARGASGDQQLSCETWSRRAPCLLLAPQLSPRCPAEAELVSTAAQLLSAARRRSAANPRGGHLRPAQRLFPPPQVPARCARARGAEARGLAEIGSLDAEGWVSPWRVPRQRWMPSKCGSAWP